MKLSKETIEVLKNFSGINQSIVVKEGSKLKTVNTLKNILAHATVEEDFPTSFFVSSIFFASFSIFVKSSCASFPK